jgi:hypothetical protein
MYRKSAGRVAVGTGKGKPMMAILTILMICGLLLIIFSMVMDNFKDR